MKKVCVIVLLAATLLLSAACSQKNNSSDKNSSTSPLSGTSSSASDISGTSSSEASVSEEEKTSSDSSTAPAIEDATFENSKDYSSNPVSKFVDVSKITDKTKADVLDVIGSSALTIKAEGSFTIAQGISVSFSAQISKDGSSSCFNLSLGGRESVVLKKRKRYLFTRYRQKDRFSDKIRRCLRKCHQCLLQQPRFFTGAFLPRFYLWSGSPYLCQKR